MDRRLILPLCLSLLIHLVVVAKLTTHDRFEAAAAPQHAVNFSVKLLQIQPSSPVVTGTETPIRTPHVVEKKLEHTPRKQVKTMPPVAEPLRTQRQRPQQQVAAATALQDTSETAPVQAAQMERGVEDSRARVRERYLADLLKHIEHFKYYPQAARRRGISGAINVVFELRDSGQISELSITDGPMLLRRAARQAVQQAVPMLAAPHEIVMPMKVSFVMRYRLD